LSTNQALHIAPFSFYRKCQLYVVPDLKKLARRIARGQLKKGKKIYEAMGKIKERYPRASTTTGEILRIRRGVNVEPEHLAIYRSLGIPCQVMKPIKIWRTTDFFLTFDEILFLDRIITQCSL